MQERTDKVVYRELSYQIMGSMYNVYNTLGYGHAEKIYERALSNEFRAAGLAAEPQKVIPMFYAGERIGSYVIDFVIENKVVLELKVAERFRIKDFQQITSYLKANDMKLGILILITREGIRYRRILNIRQ